MSQAYELKLTVDEMPLADFIANYQHPEKYQAYCRECENYGTKWSCPPLNVDAAVFLQPYSYVTVAAVQMVYHAEVIESTPAERVKEVTWATIRPVKDWFHDAMLAVEQKVSGSIMLSSGGCTLCAECSRPAGEPCRQPQRMRYSLDSFGFDLSAITEELLGIKLLWCKGKLPAYYTLVHALLEHEPAAGTVERILRSALSV